jgi:hypothetical protein
MLFKLRSPPEEILPELKLAGSFISSSSDFKFDLESGEDSDSDDY